LYLARAGEFLGLGAAPRKKLASLDAIFAGGTLVRGQAGF
jgi:hypothetical protein